MARTTSAMAARSRPGRSARAPSKRLRRRLGAILVGRRLDLERRVLDAVALLQHALRPRRRKRRRDGRPASRDGRSGRPRSCSSARCGGRGRAATPGRPARGASPPPARCRGGTASSDMATRSRSRPQVPQTMTAAMTRLMTGSIQSAAGQQMTRPADDHAEPTRRRRPPCAGRRRGC